MSHTWIIILDMVYLILDIFRHLKQEFRRLVNIVVGIVHIKNLDKAKIMNIHEPFFAMLDWHKVMHPPDYGAEKSELSKFRRYLDSFMKKRGFSLVGQGRCRRTYLSYNKRYVIKFAHNSDGINANINENKRWHCVKNKPDKNGVYYCPCRIIKRTVLLMKAVTKSFGNAAGDDQAYRRNILQKIKKSEFKNMPNWVYELDCNQAGYLPDGRLVAYDYE